ncbi:MAG TPA: hypothetical protein VFD80_00615 [Flavobacteriaceae bacterium]|nr:hypothetical protein [Flavobacteriaceae bacterium]
MKKALFLMVALMAITACKNEKEQTVAESQELEGDFIFFEDVAVLKGNTFIYGVTINDKARELAEQTAQVKAEDYDMVSVKIKGKVHPKPEDEEGWEEIVTIEEILFVDDKPVKEDIRIE